MPRLESKSGNFFCSFSTGSFGEKIGFEFSSSFGFTRGRLYEHSSGIEDTDLLYNGSAASLKLAA
jgi:hypothetical protein